MTKKSGGGNNGLLILGGLIFAGAAAAIIFSGGGMNIDDAIKILIQANPQRSEQILRSRQQGYVIAWATAVKQGQQYFNFNNETFISSTGTKAAL